MSQRRYVVALFSDYTKANEAKEIFVKENPDIKYQIRRKRGNSFAVVKRVESTESNPTTKSKKRPKKYRYFEVENV